MAECSAVFPADRALYEKDRYSAAIRSGDLLFVSGQVGARPDGLPESDLHKQVQLAYDRLEAVLKAGGCTFDDVIDVTIFSTDPKGQSAITGPARAKAFGRAPFPSLTVVGVTWLSGFDFEIKVIARIPRPTVNRHNPPTIWDMAAGGFSQISVAEPGRLALLSGQIAAAPESTDLPGDVAAQARLVTKNLDAALKELAASPQDIVMLRVYVVDATTQQFQHVLEALRELLGEAKPSITTLGVQALYSPEIKVEVEMVVRVP